VDFDALYGKLIFYKEDQGAIVQDEDTKMEEPALPEVAITTAASCALARRATSEVA
jgi:hypothetical protein